MMKFAICFLALGFVYSTTLFAQSKPPVLTISTGKIEGVIEASGVHSFKGIPYAAPPVGALRFREPQPAKSWTGVRKADHFGPRAMQLGLFSDMQFRSDGMSEDCLYLNVWTPGSGSKLPVLVYFYGGGFRGGDGSEYRYDGESLATKGCVTVTLNYRLGIFGFLSLPELTKESPNHASGNYGLLDQHAALEWVKQNIAAFGGDPEHVTIAGESAGSFSVSAQMASPLSKGLFAAAIGESGSLLGKNSAQPLEAGERDGSSFGGKLVGDITGLLAKLRAMPADSLLAATAKSGWFPVVVDGYFFPKTPRAIFAAGEQMHVPLLAGWNSAEQNYKALVGNDTSVEHYQQEVHKAFGDKADKILEVYKATTPAEVKKAATALESDNWIAYGTWKWLVEHLGTGGSPVYRYWFAHPRPASVDGKTPAAEGAGHSWEIEYALGNLKTNKVYAWTPLDYRVSDIMENYFANFIKTYNPNGNGLPNWQPLSADDPSFMVIDGLPHMEKDHHADRYRLLDSF